MSIAEAAAMVVECPIVVVVCAERVGVCAERVVSECIEKEKDTATPAAATCERAPSRSRGGGL